MSEQLHLKTDLTNYGFTEVMVDIDRHDLETAIGHYQDFLLAGESQHAGTRYVTDTRGDGEFGQYRRIAGQDSDRGPLPDNKDIFHFGAHTISMTGAQLKDDMASETSRFLSSAREIFHAVQNAKRRTLRILDEYEDGFAWALTPPDEKLNDVLRFVMYYGNDDEYLAHGHFDRAVATMAVGESHPGLGIAPGQNGMVRNIDEAYMRRLENSVDSANYRERRAKFFLGAGWNRLPIRYRVGNTNLPLGWHDVIKTADQPTGEVKRWAIVNFSNPYLGMENYTVPTPPETRPYKQLGRISCGL